MASPRENLSMLVLKVQRHEKGKSFLDIQTEEGASNLKNVIFDFLRTSFIYDKSRKKHRMETDDPDVVLLDTLKGMRYHGWHVLTSNCFMHNNGNVVETTFYLEKSGNDQRSNGASVTGGVSEEKTTLNTISSDAASPGGGTSTEHSPGLVGTNTLTRRASFNREKLMQKYTQHRKSSFALSRAAPVSQTSVDGNTNNSFSNSQQNTSSSTNSPRSPRPVSQDASQIASEQPKASASSQPASSAASGAAPSSNGVRSGGATRERVATPTTTVAPTADTAHTQEQVSIKTAPPAGSQQQAQNKQQHSPMNRLKPTTSVILGSDDVADLQTVIDENELNLPATPPAAKSNAGNSPDLSAASSSNASIVVPSAAPAVRGLLLADSSRIDEKEGDDERDESVGAFRGDMNATMRNLQRQAGESPAERSSHDTSKVSHYSRLGSTFFNGNTLGTARRGGRGNAGGGGGGSTAAVGGRLGGRGTG